MTAVNTRSALVAVDLDQTLIYSDGFLGRMGATDREAGTQLERVETHVPSGTRTYVAEAVHRRLDALRLRATVVPVTTRTRAQFDRVAPIGSIPFDRTICANGGILLVNGEPDSTWAAEVEGDLLGGWALEQASGYLDELGLSDKVARLADGVFCYLVVNDVDQASSMIDRIRSQLEPHGWAACLNGRKLYALPASLTKARAVDRLARRLDVDVVVAIGDSVLDLPMLVTADFAIAPRHADTALREVADHVTLSTGPLSAVEALDTALEWLNRPIADVGHDPG